MNEHLADRARAHNDRFIHELGAFIADFRPTIPAPAVPPEQRTVIYVVGTPRSGTTLAAEILVRALDIGFVSNIAARFPTNPETGLLLAQTMALRQQETGEASLHFETGRTPGPFGNSEFGFFWTRWLGLDDTSPHTLSGAARAQLKTSGTTAALREQIDRMIGAVDRPLLLRNVVCGVNASVLAQARPRSVFVELQRDAAATASSILRCRTTGGPGEENRLWSLRPSRAEWCTQAPTPIGQTARQVAAIRADLQRERGIVEATSDASWFVASYEDFCQDPSALVDRVAALAGNPPAGSAKPVRLSPSEEPLAPGAVEAIQEAFDELGIVDPPEETRAPNGP